MMKRIALSLLLASTVAAVPLSSARAEHKSPLADAPAVRKRVELRDLRFELGVGGGTTLNETFYHDVMVDGHLAFHITDWLAIGGAGLFGVSSLATGFHDELASTLKSPQGIDRAPGVDVANSGMNKPAWIGAAQLWLTPFTGKFSVFGKLFAHYDFYVYGGPAFVGLVKAGSSMAKACADSSKTETTCITTGTSVGGTAGGGIHAYFNDVIGLDANLRDVIIKDNPAGRDVNGDQYADKRDLTWSGHWIVTLGVTVLFPHAKISP